MLIQFSVQNFRTFRDKVTLSMVASGYDTEDKEADNVIQLPEQKLRLLKSAVVYGANASGKTKLVEALAFMKKLVLESADEENRSQKVPEPFLLDVESESQSSEFEIIFMLDDVRYRYGFEVMGTEIIAEWLFHKPKDTEVEVFYRNEEGFEPHPKLADFRIGRKVAKEGMVQEQFLWLTAAAKWNDVISKKVIGWFRQVHPLSGVEERSYMGYTLNQLAAGGNMKDAINELVKAASIGLEEIIVNKLSVEDLPADLPASMRKRIIKEVSEEGHELIQDIAKYPRYDKGGNRVGMQDFDVDKHESSGTRKYLALSGPILDVLSEGSILIVDELDARLHPNLVCKIVGLFNSKEHNPKGAQLIFNTHDTNLLDSGHFRRDQIWFTEKDRYGAATLYALSDFKVRKDANWEKNYMQGRYGGLPYLGDFDRLTQMLAPHENEG